MSAYHYCLNCGTGSPATEKKCIKCGTIFGSIKLETKNEAARPIVVKEKTKFPKLLDPSLFDNANIDNIDVETEYDFSCLAADLEKELNSSKNGAIKGLKTIKAEELFNKNK